MNWLKILHIFIGHNWSEWEFKVWDEGYYDEERWKERRCFCGKTEQVEE